ncbi:helix-turn-helix domain-containing protein [Streptomyces monticola]|uniref:Helix-turn-helix domain-containing protein n=1 Tax=Streptomyces monticola TaxID=2666263 RepID=A0ABW2JJF7_9ACTN
MPDNRQLAEQLQELKERSGRSYTAIASRTGLSRSSVHRYCQGLTVPGSFGTVERIARVCGAGQEELNGLYPAWVRAAAQAEAVDAGAAQGEDADAAEVRDGAVDAAAAKGEAVDAAAAEGEAVDAAAAEGEAVDAAAARDEGGRAVAPAAAGTPAVTSPATAPSTPEPPPPRSWLTRLRRPSLAARLRPHLLMITALLCAGGVIGYAAFGPLLDSPATGGAESARQQVRGPEWSMAPQRIDGEFFGVTMNTDTGQMPDFKVSGIRLWDGETRWGQMEPEKGELDWSVLERMVKGAERAGLPVLFTFGGTPGWAAPDSEHTLYGDDTRTAPPDDLGDWDRFVKKVATRYRDRIGAYELWDNVGATSHYSGDMRTLAAMVRRASRIIRGADPDAVVACPSFGRLWERHGQDLLREFARTGAYKYCDAAALKLHPRRADGPPEEIIELAAKVRDDVLYVEGIGLRLWNTGPGKDIVTRPQLGARRAEDYAVRFYLAGLFSRKAKLDRMYFYSWGSTGVPLVVQPVGGAPTEAGRRIGRLQSWLADARITSCGFGTRVGLPEHVYECRFQRGDGEPGTVRSWLAVRWARQGRASAELDAKARQLHRMDGGSERVRPGQRVEYGESPVLVEYGTE